MFRGDQRFIGRRCGLQAAVAETSASSGRFSQVTVIDSIGGLIDAIGGGCR